MSWLIRLGIPVAILIAGYFFIGFIANNWVWFLTAAIIIALAAVVSWLLFHPVDQSRLRSGVDAMARREIASEINSMNVPAFDLAMGGLLTTLEVRAVKRHGHKRADYGCNFLVTLNDGKKIIVRAKLDDGALRKQTERHFKAFSWEIKPKWGADAAVLVTSADLHRLNQGVRNDYIARHLGIVLIDRERLIEWMATGAPPSVLRPQRTRELTSAPQETRPHQNSFQ